MITSVKEILTKAKKGGYAVGAFNTANMETTQAIIKAASEMRSPIIIQVTEKTMNYTGGRTIFNLIKNIAEFYYPKIPVGIHLDHGKSLEIIKRVVDIGFTSVMYDGSRNKYDDNLMITKAVVEICKKKGISVQAELGSVPYFGEIKVKEADWERYMTNPNQAEEFVRATGIDALAVAIGNAHGLAKERKIPDYARLEMINKRLNIPLILHGASDWENGKVEKVIKRGICCFNIDTALRLAFIDSLANSLKNKDISFDIRKVLGDARAAVENVVKEKIKLFGSAGKA